MNERIRLLAEQAGYKDLPTVRLAFHGFDKEKFAQLIVAECAQDFDKTYMTGGETVGTYIRRKFGFAE